MDDRTLAEKTIELATRPGHEKVRTLLYAILTDALGADSSEIRFEQPVRLAASAPDSGAVHPEWILRTKSGRTDALLGRTVFEIKANLARGRQLEEAERQLTGYISTLQTDPAEPWVGIATDGAQWRAYTLDEGTLQQVSPYELQYDQEAAQADPKAQLPRDWLIWLESILQLQDAKPPTPHSVERALGRHSVAYHLAAKGLNTLWQGLREAPAVELKLKLWHQKLRDAYWADVGNEHLFRQHTYLTLIAKGIAAVVLRGGLQDTPAEVLAGKSLRQAGILGGVENDLFNWLLNNEEGDRLARRILAQLQAFDFKHVETDVLKTLYESLVDPEERHDLGEYYTPDWLAERICREAIDEPLTQRVLDPSCGSGTFLFHALRRVLDTATAAGKTPDEALALACQNVVGLEIHPVAVVLASTTVILALQNHLQQRKREGTIAIPVYLGDALQWNVSAFGITETVAENIPKTFAYQVPDGPLLELPVEVARHPELFDPIIAGMQTYLDRNYTKQAFSAWLGNQFGHLTTEQKKSLSDTYQDLLQLRREDRDSIWAYIIKHLARPIWLSRLKPGMDRIVGNPPWVAYRYMGKKKQTDLKNESQRLGLWVGGKSATAQDLSAYFFARCTELYLEPGGYTAMVLPFAAMTREAYIPFRSGKFGGPDSPGTRVTFKQAWSFEHHVQPLFGVPSCVLFAQKENPSKDARDNKGAARTTSPLPQTTQAFAGQLPRRDASLEEAEQALTRRETPWPGQRQPSVSVYARYFRKGATLIPRRFVLVEKLPAGRFGVSLTAPPVRGQSGRQDKEPWKSVPPWEGQVEQEFLRPVLLGEDLAPYRVLGEHLGVIPWSDQNILLDSATAVLRGYPQLAAWLKRAETLWDQHGRGTMSLLESLNYYGKLRSQFPIAQQRIVYTASGTYPAAALVEHPQAIIDSAFYWMRPHSQAGARYLVAVLNSEALRARIVEYQSQGQWGARHIAKTIFNAPIPQYDSENPLHRALAAASQRAEGVAAAVPLKEGAYFITQRQQIREALKTAGLAAEIDQLVEQLLSPP